MVNAMIIALQFFKFWSESNGVDFKDIRCVESKENAFGFKIQCLVRAINKVYELYVAVDDGKIVSFSNLKEL